jgi:hypothetical protein
LFALTTISDAGPYLLRQLPGTFTSALTYRVTF